MARYKNTKNEHTFTCTHAYTRNHKYCTSDGYDEHATGSSELIC